MAPGIGLGVSPFFQHKKSLLSYWTPQYQAVLDYITAQNLAEPSNIDKLYQAKLMKQLVDGEYINKAEFIDVFAFNNGASLINLANPGTFNPSINGVGLVFRDYVGYRTSAVGEIRSGFNPTANGTKIGQNNITLIVGVGTEKTAANGEIGAGDASGRLDIYAKLATNNTVYRCNTTGGYVGDIGTPTIAHYGVTRNSAANFKRWKNKTGTSVTDSSSALPNQEIYICAANYAGIAYRSDRFVRYAAVFSYLTDEEYQGFIDIMEEYLSYYGSNLISPESYIASGDSTTKAILTLETYDESDQTIHPTVVDTGIAGWNGYRYWMCNTPFIAGGGGPDIENPSIWASADGDTWVVPDGITNPIIPKPESTFNADPDLYYENDVMYLAYLEYPNIVFTKSTDSINWDTVKSIKTPDAGATSLRGPALLKGKDGRYYIYYTSIGLDMLVRRISTNDIDGEWGNIEDVVVIGAGNEADTWHIDVFLYNNYYYMIAGYASGVYVYRSDDGINFNKCSRHPVLNWWKFTSGVTAESYYREAICLIDGQPTVYYSALATIGGSNYYRTFKIDIELL